MRRILLATALMGIGMGGVKAEAVSVDGDARLWLYRNTGPAECWIETDCPEGQICHMSLRIDGEPASQLADTLKAVVPVDETFVDWGLEIYVSADDAYFCDVTEPDNVFCEFNINPAEARTEGPLSCE